MSELLWTSDEIAAAMGGASSGAAFAATGVSIDTRTLEPGDLFVALAGERDGHEFVAQAFARGAAGALVSRGVEGGPAVGVRDTLRGLQALAAAARDRSAARRCAVTGSVGKTGVTQAIAAGLVLAGPAHAAVKSYNNHIGVPLTLARMPRATERAVFEVGMNHAGEIGPLSRLVRPHVAVVTVVGPVHVENFPDGEAGVARAKAEVFEGLEPGGVAVLNADDRWFALLAESARAAEAKVVSFGTGEGCDARLISWTPGDIDSAAFVHARVHGGEVRFPLAQTGAHWGPNSLAALLALDALGVPLETGMAALAAYAPLAGRGAERQVGGVTLIDESYNANPLSMRAALATLAARPGRRLAVLTDMLELGPDAAAQHAALAEPASAADLVFTAGPLMRALHDALPPTRRGAWAASAAELAPLVADAIGPGDIVMVKGSNGSRASLIVEALSRPEKPGGGDA